jgi:hypothetical protein
MYLLRPWLVAISMAGLAVPAGERLAHASQGDATPAPPSPPADNATGATAATPALTARQTPPDVVPTNPTAPPARPWTGAATLGVVALPRVLSLEAMVLKRRETTPEYFHFGFGAGIEYLPKGLASFGPKTDFSWMQLGVDGRFFLWRWAFVGARLGYQFSRTDSEKFGSTLDYITTSFFFAPKAGVFYTFSNHITVGGDFGATIPIGADTKLESDSTEDSSARKASKTFGAFVMPFVSLFRVGYTL